MRKRNSRIALVLSITSLLAACSLNTRARHEGEPPVLPASAPPAPIFPLFGWHGVPDPDEANIIGQVECGMTVASFAGPKALPFCEKHGIPVILSDPRIRHDWTAGNEKELEAGIRAAAKEYGQHPGVFGFYVRDEPGAADFQNLARTAAILREAAPNKLVYINLFPNYASQEQLGTPTYLEHLNRFCDIVKPAFISYDNYFGMLGEEPRPEYFANLETVRQVSLERGVPFWNIILSTPHYGYREPTEWDMHFQVFTTLAYGGKGLSYFTYFTPQGANYRLGPLDQFGGKTPMWNYVRRCNFQVRALAPILLRLRSTGVYYTNPPAGADTCRKLPGNTLVKSVSGGNFLVGEFRHEDGSRWFMVVNLDRKNSAQFQAVVDGKTIRSVSAYTGRLDGELDNWLLPGQGKLCRVD
jgi:hypothetical protein